MDIASVFAETIDQVGIAVGSMAAALQVLHVDSMDCSNFPSTILVITIVGNLITTPCSS